MADTTLPPPAPRHRVLASLNVLCSDGVRAHVELAGMSAALFRRLANPTNDDYEYGLDVAQLHREGLLEGAYGDEVPIVPNDARDGFRSLPAWATVDAVPVATPAPASVPKPEEPPMTPTTTPHTATHTDGFGIDAPAPSSFDGFGVDGHDAPPAPPHDPVSTSAAAFATGMGGF